MNGEITLYNLLKSDTSITDLLTSFSGYPAVAIGIKEPTTWGINDSTLSIYNAVGVDNNNQALLTEMTINCRAPEEDAAKIIVSAVVSAVNRYQVAGNKGAFYTFTGGVIPPEDENDSYNIPITVTVSAVEDLE